MKGTIEFIFDGGRTNVKTNLKEVSLVDRLEAMRAMEDALQFNDEIFALYIVMRKEVEGSRSKTSIDLGLFNKATEGFKKDNGGEDDA